VAILFQIQRQGSDFSVTADGGPRLFVGRKVEYKGKIGLFNIFAGSKLPKLLYDPAEHAGTEGFWARFVEPTAICEGRSYLTLNTYDRAAFTFGFGQFAAHVPDGDFVRYFRTLLGQAEARDYFPHLGVINGRIHRTEIGSQPEPLESGQSTAPLMAYLNPGLSEVEDAEVIAAGKLIHWTLQHVSARAAQVQTMIATYRTFMARADNRVGIDKRPARECCVIADILHHGRGGSTTWPQIDAAVKTSDPYGSLLKIGSPLWDERLKTLRKAINDRPDFLQLRWSRSAQDFV